MLKIKLLLHYPLLLRRATCEVGRVERLKSAMLASARGPELGLQLGRGWKKAEKRALCPPHTHALRRDSTPRVYVIRVHVLHVHAHAQSWSVALSLCARSSPTSSARKPPPRAQVVQRVERDGRCALQEVRGRVLKCCRVVV